MRECARILFLEKKVHGPEALVNFFCEKKFTLYAVDREVCRYFITIYALDVTTKEELSCEEK